LTSLERRVPSLGADVRNRLAEITEHVSLVLSQVFADQRNGFRVERHTLLRAVAE